MRIRQLGRTLARRPRRYAQGRRVSPGDLDILESRQLLTVQVYTFTPPDLTGPEHQSNPAPAIFNRMVGSLQAQLSDGPLNDLTAKKINEDAFVAAVASMVSGFETTGESALQKYPVYSNLIQLQGDALNAETVVVGKIYDAGLVHGTGNLLEPDPVVPNQTNVEHLTLSRPLWPVGTLILNTINRTETFQADLGTLAANVSKTITINVADQLANLEADSFSADIALSTVHQAGLRGFMDQQVQTLRTDINAAAQSSTSGLGAFQNAIYAFTEATYDRQTGAGYLGPKGAYGRHFIQPTNGSQVSNLIPAFSDANTFAYGRYKPVRPQQDLVYHRNYGGNVSRFGRYVTTALYQNPAQVIRRNALDQAFPQANNAFHVTDVTVPKGLLRYVSRVAPIYQGVLTPRNTLYPGLGTQILLSDSRAPGVRFVNQRTTGT